MIKPVALGRLDSAVDGSTRVVVFAVMASAHDNELIRRRLDEIAERQSSIDSQITSLREESASLKAEESELIVASRVLARLRGEADLPPAEAKADGEEKPTRASSKPDGTPSLFEMADSVIQEAEAVGQVELEGSEIMARIRELWWPNVTANTVLPSLWRFAKAGRLSKNGSRYSRVKTTEPSDASAQDGPVGSADSHNPSAGLFS